MTGPSYVELVDGSIVSRDAEEWRTECLARHVLTMPRTDRRAWLKAFESENGREEAERLKAVITAVHEKARAR